MASRGPTVTLTFAGDAKDLTRATLQAETRLSRFERSVNSASKKLSLLTGASGGVAAATGAALPAIAALGVGFGVAALAMSGTSEALDAYSKALEEGKGDFSEYNKLLERMPPSQREFTKQLIAMRQPMERLQTIAKDSFLPGVTEMLKDSEQLFPIFERSVKRTGDIMADTARDLGNLFSTDRFKRNLEGFLQATEPITAQIGDTIVRLTDRIVEFGAEMKPAGEGFATFIGDLTTGVEGFLDELAPHAESFKRIWESLGSIAETLLPIIGDLAGEAADILAPALEDVAKFLKDNEDAIKAILPWVGGLVLALKGLNLARKVRGWVGGIIGAMDLIGPAADRNRKKTDDLLDSLDPDSKRNRGRKFGKFLGAGGLLVGGALAAGALAPGTADDPDTGNVVDDTANNVGGAAGMLFTDPGQALDEILAEFNEFPARFESSPFMVFFRDTLPAWWNGLWGSEGSIMSTVRGWGSSIAGAFESAKAAAIAKLTEWRDGAVAKAQEITNGVSTWIQQLPGRIGAWFEEMKARAVAKLIEWRDAAVAKASELVARVTGYISGLPGRIVGFFQRLPGEMRTIGANILNGLWDGIKSGWGWLSGRVSSLARDLFNKAKSALGIASPSKLFRDEIGRMIPEGLALGIEDNLSPVTRAMAAMTGLTTTAFAAGRGIVRAGDGSWIPRTGGSSNSGANVKFSGNTDSAFASAFMKLHRTGQIQIVV